MNQFTLTVGYSFFALFVLLAFLNNYTYFIIMVLGIVSYLLTKYLIPKIVFFMIKKQIFGYDINKKGSVMGEKKIPQCIGFAAAISYILIAMSLSLFIKIMENYNYFNKVYQQIHLSYVVTILGTILLGFADDMLDIPWRYKLIFPFFIIIPTVSCYEGTTSIILPYPLSNIVGQINLGILFLVYITLLGIYCTNTINIYAGINGLEVGQSIIAVSSLLILFGVKAFKNLDKQQVLSHNYYYAMFLLIVFLGSALALMQKNAYPSQIFIGDTFCYFAGIILALSAVISQNAINIHWFLIPQLINFLYSCPQLFGIYPCPRHRLTTFNKEQNKLYPIKQNMNLLNLSLRILGPTNQGLLCKKLLIFQIITSSFPIIYQILNNK